MKGEYNKIIKYIYKIVNFILRPFRAFFKNRLIVKLLQYLGLKEREYEYDTENETRSVSKLDINSDAFLLLHQDLKKYFVEASALASTKYPHEILLSKEVSDYLFTEIGIDLYVQALKLGISNKLTLIIYIIFLQRYELFLAFLDDAYLRQLKEVIKRVNKKKNFIGKFDDFFDPETLTFVYVEKLIDYLSNPNVIMGDKLREALSDPEILLDLIEFPPFDVVYKRRFLNIEKSNIYTNISVNKGKIYFSKKYIENLIEFSSLLHEKFLQSFTKYIVLMELVNRNKRYIDRYESVEDDPVMLKIFLQRRHKPLFLKYLSRGRVPKQRNKFITFLKDCLYAMVDIEGFFMFFRTLRNIIRIKKEQSTFVRIGFLSWVAYGKNIEYQSKMMSSWTKDTLSWLHAEDEFMDIGEVEESILDNSLHDYQLSESIEEAKEPLVHETVSTNASGKEYREIDIFFLDYFYNFFEFKMRLKSFFRIFFFPIIFLFSIIKKILDGFIFVIFSICGFFVNHAFYYFIKFLQYLNILSFIAYLRQLLLKDWNMLLANWLIRVGDKIADFFNARMPFLQKYVITPFSAVTSVFSFLYTKIKVFYLNTKESFYNEFGRPEDQAFQNTYLFRFLSKIFSFVFKIFYYIFELFLIIFFLGFKLFMLYWLFYVLLLLNNLFPVLLNYLGLLMSDRMSMFLICMFIYILIVFIFRFIPRVHDVMWEVRYEVLLAGFLFYHLTGYVNNIDLSTFGNIHVVTGDAPGEIHHVAGYLARWYDTYHLANIFDGRFAYRGLSYIYPTFSSDLINYYGMHSLNHYNIRYNIRNFEAPPVNRLHFRIFVGNLVTDLVDTEVDGDENEPYSKLSFTEKQSTNIWGEQVALLLENITEFREFISDLTLINWTTLDDNLLHGTYNFSEGVTTFINMRNTFYPILVQQKFNQRSAFMRLEHILLESYFRDLLRSKSIEDFYTNDVSLWATLSKSSDIWKYIFDNNMYVGNNIRGGLPSSKQPTFRRMSYGRSNEYFSNLVSQHMLPKVKYPYQFNDSDAGNLLRKVTTRSRGHVHRKIHKAGKFLTTVTRQEQEQDLVERLPTDWSMLQKKKVTVKGRNILNLNGFSTKMYGESAVNSYFPLAFFTSNVETDVYFNYHRMQKGRAAFYIPNFLLYFQELNSVFESQFSDMSKKMLLYEELILDRYSPNERKRIYKYTFRPLTTVFEKTDLLTSNEDLDYLIAMKAKSRDHQQLVTKANDFKNRRHKKMSDFNKYKMVMGAEHKRILQKDDGNTELSNEEEALLYKLEKMYDSDKYSYQAPKSAVLREVSPFENIHHTNKFLFSIKNYSGIDEFLIEYFFSIKTIVIHYLYEYGYALSNFFDNIEERLLNSTNKIFIKVPSLFQFILNEFHIVKRESIKTYLKVSRIIVGKDLNSSKKVSEYELLEGRRYVSSEQLQRDGPVSEQMFKLISQRVFGDYPAPHNLFSIIESESLTEYAGGLFPENSAEEALRLLHTKDKVQSWGEANISSLNREFYLRSNVTDYFSLRSLTGPQLTDSNVLMQLVSSVLGSYNSYNNMLSFYDKLFSQKQSTNHVSLWELTGEHTTKSIALLKQIESIPVMPANFDYKPLGPVIDNKFYNLGFYRNDIAIYNYYYKYAYERKNNVLLSSLKNVDHAFYQTLLLPRLLTDFAKGNVYKHVLYLDRLPFLYTTTMCINNVISTSLGLLSDKQLNIKNTYYESLEYLLNFNEPFFNTFRTFLIKAVIETPDILLTNAPKAGLNEDVITEEEDNLRSLVNTFDVAIFKSNKDFVNIAFKLLDKDQVSVTKFPLLESKPFEFFKTLSTYSGIQTSQSLNEYLFLSSINEDLRLKRDYKNEYINSFEKKLYNFFSKGFYSSEATMTVDLLRILSLNYTKGWLNYLEDFKLGKVFDMYLKPPSWLIYSDIYWTGYSGIRNVGWSLSQKKLGILLKDFKIKAGESNIGRVKFMDVRRDLLPTIVQFLSREDNINTILTMYAKEEKSIDFTAVPYNFANTPLFIHALKYRSISLYFYLKIKFFLDYFTFFFFGKQLPIYVPKSLKINQIYSFTKNIRYFDFMDFLTNQITVLGKQGTYSFISRNQRPKDFFTYNSQAMIRQFKRAPDSFKLSYLAQFFMPKKNAFLATEPEEKFQKKIKVMSVFERLDMFKTTPQEDFHYSFDELGFLNEHSIKRSFSSTIKYANNIKSFYNFLNSRYRSWSLRWKSVMSLTIKVDDENRRINFRKKSFKQFQGFALQIMEQEDVKRFVKAKIYYNIDFLPRLRYSFFKDSLFKELKTYYKILGPEWINAILEILYDKDTLSKLFVQKKIKGYDVLNISDKYGSFYDYEDLSPIYESDVYPLEELKGSLKITMHDFRSQLTRDRSRKLQQRGTYDLGGVLSDWYSDLIMKEQFDMVRAGTGSPLGGIKYNYIVFSDFISTNSRKGLNIFNNNLFYSSKPNYNYDLSGSMSYYYDKRRILLQIFSQRTVDWTYFKHKRMQNVLLPYLSRQGQISDKLIGFDYLEKRKRGREASFADRLTGIYSARDRVDRGVRDLNGFSQVQTTNFEQDESVGDPEYPINNPVRGWLLVKNNMLVQDDSMGLYYNKALLYVKYLVPVTGSFPGLTAWAIDFDETNVDIYEYGAGNFVMGVQSASNQLIQDSEEHKYTNLSIFQGN